VVTDLHVGGQASHSLLAHPLREKKAGMAEVFLIFLFK